MGNSLLNEIKNKIVGGWVGKLIGNEIGRPLEGKNFNNILKEYGEVSYYVKPPNGFGPDDDPDYIVLSLHTLSSRGLNISSNDLAEEWLEHLKYAYTAEEVALNNLRRGLRPPLSAVYQNPYQEWIGAQMRGEIWGWISPSMPDLACKYAIIDATISHSGNGIYGEIFISVLCSLAFSMENITEMIKRALSYIPSDSLYFRAIKDATKRAEGRNWKQCIGLIYEKYRNYSKVHVLPNAEIIVTALLQENFEDAITCAVTAGMDTDCNAGNVGGIIGTLIGIKGIPKKFIEPLKDIYKTRLINFPLSYHNDIAILKISLISQEIVSMAQRNLKNNFLL